MKTRSISLKELDAIDPAKLIYASWVGSDDILVMDGTELIEMAEEDNGKRTKKLTLRQAIEQVTEDESGNSFEFILINRGKPVKLSIDWPEEE